MRKLLLALLAFCAPAFAAQSGVGINLQGLSYYAQSAPMIDVMKQAGPWITSAPGAWDTGEEATLQLDADDYPLSLPAATDTSVAWRFVSTMLFSSNALPPGTYVLTYDGEGAISYGGAAKDLKLSKAGRDVLTIAGPSAYLMIKATNPANHVRNMHLWRPGGGCSNDLSVYAADASACTLPATFVPYESFPASMPWYQPWLADMKGFRALRFMDWNATNSTAVTKWADRTTPTRRTWAGRSGVPIEVELDLANQLQADAWLNVPPYVQDTDYALQIGKLAASRLTGASRLDLEYANETWNYRFNATKWLYAQTQAHWPTQWAAPGTNTYYMARSFYAQRLIQMCNAAKSANPTTRCVANVQHGAAQDAKLVLNCTYAVALERDRPCGREIDVLAVAPYFAYYIPSVSPAVRNVVKTWPAQPDGGMSALFAEINSGGLGFVDAPAGSLAQIDTWTRQNVALAATFGIPVWAYEAGQSLVVPDADPALQAMVVAAQRDPRMGAAYDRMVSDWNAAGGQVLNFFTYAGVPTNTGAFGMKLSISDDASPKWQAAVRARNLPCPWAACETKTLASRPAD